MHSLKGPCGWLNPNFTLYIKGFRSEEKGLEQVTSACQFQSWTWNAVFSFLGKYLFLIPR